MAQRQLVLKRFAVTHVDYQWLGAYRLRVEVSDPNNSGADTYVFLYDRKPINPYNGQVDDFWMGTCSVLDLSTYPLGQPNDDTTYPLFRLNYIEIDFPSLELANTAWLAILEQVGHLLAALKRADTLDEIEEVTLGDDIDTGSSESSESSLSS